MSRTGRTEGTVWTFKSGRYLVSLIIVRDYCYQYDGVGRRKTQAKLDSGEYVAFDSTVTVEFEGVVIGRDDLGGSVYAADEIQQFWQAHRTDPAGSRNTLENKARGVVYCHYFPDMVRIAIANARTFREALAA